MTSASINNSYQDYVNNLPQNIPLKAAQSFVISSVLQMTISGGLLAAGIVSGSLAAVASLVEACVRPIFKKIFPENLYIAHIISYGLAHGVTLGFCNILLPWVGISLKVTPIVIDLILFYCLNYGYGSRNEACAFTSLS